MVRIRGSYALAVMFKDYPEEIYVSRKDSPMILGIEDGESYIASDVPAILKYTRNVYYIGNMELACVRKGEITFYNLDGEEIEKELKTIEWDAEAAEKAGFEHFMMKEIHEQPKVVGDTLNSVLKDGQFDLSSVGLSEEEIKDISQIYIVACGSAYHVGIAAQYVIEDLAKIPVRVELGSEFRYRNPLLDPKGLVIVISQSGETADSLAALRESKEKGVRTMAIVNVVGSSIAREADSVFYTLAGPEIAVAATKAYSTQLMATYILALQFAKVRGEISDETYKNMIGKLFGGWGLYEDGQFTTESIENFMLFVPFSILLLWAFQKELLDESENIRFGKTVWEATKVVAIFSFMIEFTQLLFHLGTFQISDLTYNTLGGAVGGVIYYLGYSRRRKK